MDCRKVSRLERLRRRYRITLHEGRNSDARYDLLGDKLYRDVVSPLLRLLECERVDLGKGRHQELGRRFTQGPGRVRPLSKRYQSPVTRLGREILRCTTLDRNAARWPFRRNGRTATIG